MWLASYIKKTVDLDTSGKLDALFDQWQTNCKADVFPRPISVVVEGAGDALCSRYLPTLLDFLSENFIALTIVDLGQMSDELRNLLGYLRPRVQYVQKFRTGSTSRTTRAYDVLRRSPPDVLLVVVPDMVHISTVREWLLHGAPTVILVEKPYDVNPDEANRLHQELKAHPFTLVLPVDHYLGKLTPVIIDPYRGSTVMQRILDAIGPIHTIRFDLLETEAISPDRVSTLERGLIYDLFSHVLAVTLALLWPVDDQNPGDEDPRGHIEQVCRASYTIAGDPALGENETFGHIRMTFNPRSNYPVKLISSVGKGVRAAYNRNGGDTKFLRVEGYRGVCEIDFEGTMHGEVGVRKRLVRGRRPAPSPLLDPADRAGSGRKLADGHREMLRCLLSGRYLAAPAAALPRERARWILSMVWHAVYGHHHAGGLVPGYELVNGTPPPTNEELLALCRNNSGCVVLPRRVD